MMCESASEGLLYYPLHPPQPPQPPHHTRTLGSNAVASMSQHDSSPQLHQPTHHTHVWNVRNSGNQ